MSETCAGQLEAEILREYSGVFRKTGVELEILTEAKRVHFSEAAGQLDNTEAPYAVQMLHPYEFVVVWIFGWEWRSVKIVNIKNGEVFPIEGFPLLSPDKRRVLVYSEAIESNYYPNLLRIYRVEEGALVLELSLDGDTDPARSWGPESARWIDSDTVEFIRAEWLSGERVTVPRRLRLGKLGWELL